MKKGKEKDKRKKTSRKKRGFGWIFCVTLFLVLLTGTVILLLKTKDPLQMLGTEQEAEKGKSLEADMGTEKSPSADSSEKANADHAISKNMKSDMRSDSEELAEHSENDLKYAELLADENQMKIQNVHAMEAASDERIVMDFAGDILFDPGYAVMSTLKQNGGNIESGISAALLEQMRSADLMMINNEFAFSDRGTPTEGKQYTFRAPTSYTSYLTDMGVDLVSLANNHAYDYGETAFLDTMDALKAEGILYVGAGKNLEEASKTISFVINDTKIAIISATQIERNDVPDTKGATNTDPGVFRCWNPELLLQRIEEARKENDYVIVYIHWGTEKESKTDWAQDDQAVKIAQAGADLIIGDHPHVLQPVGYVDHVPVIYSLGNFWFNSKTLDTCLLQVVIEDEQMSVQIIPARQQNCYTTMLGGEEKSGVISYINSISQTGYLDEDGFLKENA